jgi:hypothetical protein
MDTINLLKWCLRVFFWFAVLMGIRRGDLFAIGLSATIFLVIEYYLEDLEATQNK